MPGIDRRGKRDRVRGVLTSGKMLVLEVKGRDTQQDKSKRASLAEWVKAVNEHGGFRRWAWGVSRDPADIGNILAHNAD